MLNTINDAAEKLRFALAAYQGEFALLGIECETELQPSFVSYFEQASSLNVLRIQLAPTDKLLLNTLSNKLTLLQCDCVIVEGLDQVKELDEMLAAANFVRDEFKKKFQFPLIILFNQSTWIKLFRLAPDFESWMIKTKIERDNSVANIRTLGEDKLKIGLSFSLCMSDILEGKVKEEQVNYLIVSCRWRTSEELDKLLLDYAESDYWPKESIPQIKELIKRLDIHQPRLKNIYHHPSIVRGHWVNSESEIIWSDETESSQSGLANLAKSSES